MQALSKYSVGMKSTQYTVRGVPEKLDTVAREQAQKYHKSLNALLVEALAKGLGVTQDPVTHNDMDDLAGTWVEDDAFDDAIAAFDVVDENLWK